MFVNFSRKIFKSLFFGILPFIFMSGCSSKIQRHPEVISTQKSALNGYDPVEYFLSLTAKVGKKEFSYEYNGLNWYFVNKKNLELFKNDPKHYIPALGGYDAYELGDGDFVISNPKYWHIHNNKLYLFEDEDNKNDWFRDIDNLLPRAQEYYKQSLLAPKKEK